MINVQDTGVRLVDGTPSYETTTRPSLSPENAPKLIPQQTVHRPWSIRRREPCVTARPAGSRWWPTVQQFLRLPSDEDLYAAKMQVAEDGSQPQIFLTVPPSAAGFVQDGEQFPAKRLPAGPNVLTVDWAAVQQNSGASGMLA